MKKYIYLMLSVVLAGIFAGCSKDDPFDPTSDSATGRLLTSSLDVSLKNDYGPRSLKNRAVRAAAPDVNDFTVEFYLDGRQEAVASYLYSKMPEIVTLPVGHYTAKAFYGDNPVAAWESPYYEGTTSFDIVADEITENVEPIVCNFANIRVSIYFDDMLRKSMGPDCKVSVKVGESGELDFTLDDEYVRSGYFAYVEGSNTLAAVFSGTVDGVFSTESKTDITVQKGKHYQITFRMYDAGEEDPGFIVPGQDSGKIIVIESDVVSENIDGSVDSGEGTIEDDMRPQEGDIDNPGKDDPKPDDPVDPSNPKPQVTVDAPYSMDVEQDLRDDPVIIHVHSSAEGGIQAFKVEIDSEKLDANELETVGLNRYLDLINPGQYEEGLTDLGFPVKNSVKGQSDVDLTISSDFTYLLGILGTSYHHFILTVTDANGTTVSTLKLNVK